MLEVGFTYKRHKKLYCADWHNDTDVLANQNKYIAEFFDEELLEYCWTQLSKQIYLQPENKNILALKIKTKRRQERQKIQLIF
jgi:hypothetical protein